MKKELPFLFERPETDEASFAWFMEHFNEVGTERPVGMDIARLPRSSIKAYGIDIGLDGADLAFFIKVMRGFDDRFIALHREKDNGEDTEAPSNSAKLDRTGKAKTIG